MTRAIFAAVVSAWVALTVTMVLDHKWMRTRDCVVQR